jgi:hypothetical protein
MDDIDVNGNSRIDYEVGLGAKHYLYSGHGCL